MVVLMANWHSGFTAAILAESYQQITTSLSAERHGLQRQGGDDDADSSFRLKKLREDGKMVPDWERATDILDTFDAPNIDSGNQGLPEEEEQVGEEEREEGVEGGGGR